MAILLKIGVGYHKNALFDRMTSSILKKVLRIYAFNSQPQLFGKSKQKLTPLPNLAQSSALRTRCITTN